MRKTVSSEIRDLPVRERRQRCCAADGLSGTDSSSIFPWSPRCDCFAALRARETAIRTGGPEPIILVLLYRQWVREVKGFTRKNLFWRGHGIVPRWTRFPAIEEAPGENALEGNCSREPDEREISFHRESSVIPNEQRTSAAEQWALTWDGVAGIVGGPVTQRSLVRRREWLRRR